MGVESEEGKDGGDPSKLTRYPPEQYAFDGEGMKKLESPVSISLGREEDILAMLRLQGFSEEAIEAFRTGKPIMMTYQQTPFGRVVLDEQWLDKDRDEEAVPD